MFQAGFSPYGRKAAVVQELMDLNDIMPEFCLCEHMDGMVRPNT